MTNPLMDEMREGLLGGDVCGTMAECQQSSRNPKTRILNFPSILLTNYLS